MDPALVLGMGGESGFGTAGTYLRTGDAFGMTGGSTRHMTHARNPAENVQQFFDNFGPRIQGSGSNVEQFLDGLQGIDSHHVRRDEWGPYNSQDDKKWRKRRSGEIVGMEKVLPAYLQSLPRKAR